jgi:hypothetical protein
LNWLDADQYYDPGHERHDVVTHVGNDEDTRGNQGMSTTHCLELEEGLKVIARLLQ